MVLIKKEQVVAGLTSQSARLLEIFLQAEEHGLSTSDISEKLWSNGSGTREKIHTLIYRLRKSISGVTPLEIKLKEDAYYLIIPHFIGENALIDGKNIDGTWLANSDKN